jgi:hypothetical protein
VARFQHFFIGHLHDRYVERFPVSYLLLGDESRPIDRLHLVTGLLFEAGDQLIHRTPDSDGSDQRDFGLGDYRQRRA